MNKRMIRSTLLGRYSVHGGSKGKWIDEKSLVSPCAEMKWFATVAALAFWAGLGVMAYVEERAEGLLAPAWTTWSDGDKVRYPLFTIELSYQIQTYSAHG